MKIVCSVLILLSALSLYAGPKIEFVSTEISIDTISYKGDTAVATFVFVNKGDENLIIRDATPSCMCIETEWTSETLPSDTGFVKAKYVPDTRGSFRKRINVFSNSDGRSVRLYISGVVEGK